jgi:hypothetical protein
VFLQPSTPDDLGRPRVELVGLTWNTVPRNNAWQPNGSPMALPEWAKSIPQLGPEGTGETPVLLYEIHGLRDTPSVNFHESSISTGDQELTGAVFRQAMIRFQAVGETANETPKISISDEPWGPWRTITKSGEMSSPVSDDSPYRLGYAMVTAHGVRPLRRNTQVQGLILQHPKEFRDLYDFEIEELWLSPTIGPSDIRGGDSSPVGEGNNARVEIEFPLPSHADLKEYRYRIRPYRHQFTFENVNFAPSQNPANYSQFKTVYKKLKHDLPEPLAAVTDEDDLNKELIRKLSDPDQAIRDQAAAQLKTLFKPSPKQPWQEKIDGIPEGASRAEVFAKLGINEKRDLFVAIDSQEHYRLDNTWMVPILFADDPGKVRTLELFEQLNRPLVAPPENFTGTWVIYYVNGVKANEIELRNGRYHGRQRSYHSNGRLHVQQHYTNQGADSEDTVYYDSGQLMYRGWIENSKPVGTWIYYNEDGSERSRTEHALPTKPLADAQAASWIPLQVVDAQTSQPISGAEVVVRQTISTSQPQAKEGKLNLSNAIPESRLRVKSDASGRVEFIIPAAMREWQSDLQVSVRHPDYVIEQSFGSWQVTAEMAENPAQIPEMLFPKGSSRSSRALKSVGRSSCPMASLRRVSTSTRHGRCPSI